MDITKLVDSNILEIRHTIKVEPHDESDHIPFHEIQDCSPKSNLRETEKDLNHAYEIGKKVSLRGKLEFEDDFQYDNNDDKENHVNPIAYDITKVKNETEKYNWVLTDSIKSSLNKEVVIKLKRIKREPDNTEIKNQNNKDNPHTVVTKNKTDINTRLNKKVATKRLEKDTNKHEIEKILDNKYTVQKVNNIKKVTESLYDSSLNEKVATKKVKKDSEKNVIEKDSNKNNKGDSHRVNVKKKRTESTDLNEKATAKPKRVKRDSDKTEMEEDSINKNKKVDSHRVNVKKKRTESKDLNEKATAKPKRVKTDVEKSEMEEDSNKNNKVNSHRVNVKKKRTESTDLNEKAATKPKIVTTDTGKSKMKCSNKKNKVNSHRVNVKKETTDTKDSSLNLKAVTKSKTVKTDTQSSDLKDVSNEKSAEHICKVCGNSYTLRVNLHRHYNIRHLNRRFSCTICQKTFTLSHYLRDHIQFVHEKKKRTVLYKCAYCLFSTNYRKSIVRHEYIYHTESGVSCQFTKYNNKIRKRYPKKKPETYICDYCGAKRIGMRSLTRHIRLHTGITPYSCKICLKKYTTSGGLKKHMNGPTHRELENIVRYFCDICSKSSRCKWALGKHIKTHHNASR